MQFQKFDLIVVGAGFFGSVIAERAATVLNKKVLIIEKRNHVGGNAYSYLDPQTGIEVHKYGSHIFHTSNGRVWSYLQKFSTFNSYRHKVLTQRKGRTFFMPISLHTINAFYDVNLRPFEVHDFIRQEIEKEPYLAPLDLEEKAISLIGRPLYEAFIKGYTVKQWGQEPKELPAEIVARLPVRENFNVDYFDDLHQGIPTNGYGKLFEKMLDHPNIEVKTDVDFFEIRHLLPSDALTVYSGPIDRFFDFKYGPLSWRTIDFESEVLNLPDFQGTAVMNYADLENPYIRTHEFKYYHPERRYSDEWTIVFHEKARSAQGTDLLCYPVNTRQDKNRLIQYQSDAQKLEKVILGGRLGTYRYLDMHQVVEEALDVFEGRVATRFANQ